MNPRSSDNSTEGHSRRSTVFDVDAGTSGGRGSSRVGLT